MLHIRRTRRKRLAREIPEREIALAVCLELAQGGTREFSLLGFYDDDIEYLDDLMKRLRVDGSPGAPIKAWRNKVRKVVQHLVKWNVLYASRRGTHKEYLGEPTQQTNYGFVNPGKYHSLNSPAENGRWGSYREAEFLLRHAYPRPDDL